jgi:hypothetical protein
VTINCRETAAIEALYPDRLEEHFEALADHHTKSEDTAKAVQYLEKAGDKALGLSQAGPALGYYRGALDLLTRSGRGSDTQRLRIRIGLKWGRLSWVRPADVLDQLNELAKLAHQLGDQISEAKLIAFTGIAALYLWYYAEWMDEVWLRKSPPYNS